MIPHLYDLSFRSPSNLSFLKQLLFKVHWVAGFGTSGRRLDVE